MGRSDFFERETSVGATLAVARNLRGNGVSGHAALYEVLSVNGV